MNIAYQTIFGHNKECNYELDFHKVTHLICAILIEYVDVDECNDAQYCEYGGTCVNREGSAQCHCIAGWEGDRCQTGKVQNY